MFLLTLSQALVCSGHETQESGTLPLVLSAILSREFEETRRESRMIQVEKKVSFTTTATISFRWRLRLRRRSHSCRAYANAAF